MKKVSKLSLHRLTVKFLFLAALITAVDQLTKYLAFDALFLTNISLEVSSFLNLVPVWNKGVSFGILSDHGELMPRIITVITLLITFCLLIWLIKAPKGITKISLSLIIGGAVGNIIDRVNHGAVIDFLDFHAFGFHFMSHIYSYDLPNKPIFGLFEIIPPFAANVISPGPANNC